VAISSDFGVIASMSYAEFYSINGAHIKTWDYPDNLQVIAPSSMALSDDFAVVGFPDDDDGYDSVVYVFNLEEYKSRF